ncbi:MAG: formylglycine-generating enzyme family protein, partial [Chloroflexota bacterium]
LERDALPEPLLSYTAPEAGRLLQELVELATTAETEGRRRDIGDRLAVISDPREGIGVKDGLPDMLWLPVTGSNGAKIAFPETDWSGNDDGTWGEFAVADFFIAKYLTTYEQYQAFVSAEDGYQNKLWWQDFPEQYQPQELSEQRTKSPNNPRDRLSWYQSVAFGRWMTLQFAGLELEHPSGDILRVGDNAEIRIPTEWEWQWAAMNGSEKWKYPWGAWEVGHANMNESGLGRAIAVGMYPHGEAVCGALDMSGNLYEWCANNHDDPEVIDTSNTSSKVLRGGSFYYRQSYARSSSRLINYPNSDRRD